MSDTDTNQASEDELTKIIDRVYLFGMNGGLGYGKFDNELSPNDAKASIQTIIRTEKLKLLAEVKERVVGEDERLDIQSDYDKLDVPHPETDRYPGLDGVRQASRNLCRERQRAELTKLEAEL